MEDLCFMLVVSVVILSLSVGFMVAVVMHLVKQNRRFAERIELEVYKDAELAKLHHWKDEQIRIFSPVLDLARKRMNNTGPISDRKYKIGDSVSEYILMKIRQ